MKKVFIIFLFALLAVTALALWNHSYQLEQQEAYISVDNINESSRIPAEEGVFERAHFALEYSIMPVDEDYQRDLDSYYKNRAFYGAPPTVPHKIEQGSIGSKQCLKCHENGGFVQKLNAYTPVTPHPEKINCMQCHVKALTDDLFVSSSWNRNSAPAIGNQALIGSPPIIPHQTQLRENCLSCHAGPSAAKEIRTTHPNRVNCRQCHVVNDKKTIDIGNFNRDLN